MKWDISKEIEEILHSTGRQISWSIDDISSTDTHNTISSDIYTRKIFIAFSVSMQVIFIM